MKIVKSLQGLGTLLKDYSETIINETKEQKTGFFLYVINYFRC